MATCRIQKENFIICNQDTWERDPHGFCLLHSRQEDKDQDGKFTEAVKKKIAIADFDFQWVFFPGLADFSGQKFSTEANFSKATFSGLVIFREATFSAGANFSWTSFSSDASFLYAIFSGYANFKGSTFSGEADFYKATFSDKADFFGNIISATGQLFLRFINPPDEKNRRLPFRADFSFLNQELGARLLFQDLSLARVELYDTDLRKAEFNRLTWAFWWGRTAIYDEILLHQRRWAHITYVLNYGWLWGKRIPGEIEKDIPKKPDFEDFAPVENLYRQLKANYEEERDFKRVGDFHYGEMEMHRRGSFWRQWVPFSWLNLYRVLSGYGERPFRAFIWLLLLIPAWAGLVWGLGINQAGSQDPINYWDTLFFIFEKATLQRPPLPEGITWLGKVLASFSVLLLPGQAALFILALRNRLGRRR